MKQLNSSINLSLKLLLLATSKLDAARQTETYLNQLILSPRDTKLRNKIAPYHLSLTTELMKTDQARARNQYSIVNEKIQKSHKLNFNKKHKSLDPNFQYMTPFKTASSPKTAIKFPKLKQLSVNSDRKFNLSTRTKALLLQDYKPSEFGNTKIDLTIDGGQHLRSAEDDQPP